MAKKARRGRPRVAVDHSEPVPVVGMREPCPCGSGKRYKLCHGRVARQDRPQPPRRPFEGLPSEADWIALHVFVPAATTPLRLTGAHAGRKAMLCTVLPGAMPARVQPDGTVWVAAQTFDPNPEDPGRDQAAALLAALEATPGESVEVPPTRPDGPRIQDFVDAGSSLEITVHDGVGFWADDLGSDTATDMDTDTDTATDTATDTDTGRAGDDRPAMVPELAEMIERVNEDVHPTARLSTVEGAYWVRSTDKCHLRWVVLEDEERVLDGLARLHAAGTSAMIEDSRLIGSFRANGAVIPVWELPHTSEAELLEEPAAKFADRLAEAIAETAPLTSQERGARAGLLNRQITIR